MGALQSYFSQYALANIVNMEKNANSVYHSGLKFPGPQIGSSNLLDCSCI